MPRLLLVDDNPSIHKIAETLLAGTEVVLTCVASGPEALALLEQGERFDVAMLDISMMGMDGWELLAKVRQQEACALMPVAMMAGVLDVVDPERLRLAPIQGFLKKPIELRDLASRVQRLLETPVVPAPSPEPEPLAASPFVTMPGFRVADHPELLERHPASPEDLLLLGPEDLYPGEATTRTTEVPAAQAGAFDLVDDSLDLEELDLDSLRELTPAPAAASEAAPAAQEDLEDFSLVDSLFRPTENLEHLPDVEVITAAPDFAPGDTFPPTPQAVSEAPELDLSELPDLFPAEAKVAEPAPADLSELPPSLDGDFLDWTEDSDTLLAALPAAANEPPDEVLDFDLTEAEVEPHNAITLSEILDPGRLEPEALAQPATLAPEEEELELDLLTEALLAEEPEAPAEALAPPAPEVAEPVAEPVATEPEPEVAEFVPALQSVPTEPVPEVAEFAPASAPSAPVAAADPLAALLADPVLMERLTKAVVARLGDQVLREIAWEVMPELSDRLHQR